MEYTYEDFLKKKTRLSPGASGDFYTPMNVAQCIGALLNPTGGSLYDPCCGSGVMLSGASQRMSKDASFALYGQAQDSESQEILKMNSVLHGADIDLGSRAACTLTDDQHPGKLFDYIIANPPFNLSGWYDGYGSVYGDSRWHYGIPPRSNANFAWLQHVLSHLKEDGRAAVLMPNGSLTGRVADESRIREAIVRDGKVEGIIAFPAGLFYSTKVSFCLWLLNNNRDCDKILLVDAEKLEPKIKKTVSAQNVENLVTIVDDYRRGNLKEDRTETFAVVTLEELAQKEYILSPNLYTSVKYLESSVIRANISRLPECINALRLLSADESLLADLTQWERLDMVSTWRKAPLSDLYEIFGGLSKNKEAFGQGQALLDVKTIIRHPFLPDNLHARVRVSKEEAAKYNIKYGDVLLNRTSETNDELACCCVAAKDSEAVYASFVKRLRPVDNKTIYPLYAAGYFRSAAYRREIDNVSTVFTKYASMDNAKLSKVSFYYPEHAMQKKIGDTLFAVFERLRNNTDIELRSLLMEFARLLIEQYITYPILRLLDSEDKNR
ncbi:MAG: N-6 DNA methylase [Clostridiales Family XIII bacterium]|jgi:type I restriction enzyme M protein|nr:N-6 DNA methylase [Clostridiales Family XIII bacterium]